VVANQADRADLRPLRVLAVTNLWPEGDSFRGIFVREQVEMLRELGVEVDVEVVAQRRGRLDYLMAARRVRARLAGGRYDLVHVHYGLTTIAARPARGVPRVVTLYGSDVNVRWQRAITKVGGRGAAARIYLSRPTAVVAGEPDGIVIPNGVDFRLFAPADRAAARAALGVEDDRKIVLFGAHPQNPIKGYDVFTDVLTELRRRGLAVAELILAEPGQPRHAVPAKFAAADVLLFTSRKGFESSPTVVKESTAMGLPVVSVGVGDVAELLAGVTPSAVVEYPNGWGTAQARQHLVTELADRTAEVLEAGIRSNGREVNARLDLSQVTAAVVDVYRQVLAASARDRGGIAA
jgi:glycosyltransferase involved in cell wall biosynthesis